MGPIAQKTRGPGPDAAACAKPSLLDDPLMFPFHSKPDPRPTFEDIFFEHYVRLLEWAMQLTSRNRSDAEDLVQELYVRFAGTGPVGEHIENAEDYLFSVLRQ
jgi:hypothetical protein